MGWQIKRVRGALKELPGAAPASKRYPTCAKAGKEGRAKGRRALLTDLPISVLRLPRVHALRAPWGAPPRSGACRLWRELERARWGRGNPKVGGRKNIAALTPRGSSGSLGSWGQSQGAGAAARGHLPARRLSAPHLAREARRSAQAGSRRVGSSCQPALPLRPGTTALFLLPPPKS